MNETEALALLAVCASFDNRKPNGDTAKAWSMALADLRFIDARDAVVEHYRKSRDWMMPVDVIKGVKRIREARRMAFGPLPEPPRNLGDDGYFAWLADLQQRIGDGDLQPSDIPQPALERHDVAELGMAGQPIDHDRRAAARAAMREGRAASKVESAPVEGFPVTVWHGPERKGDAA